jgi:hypothetical protein
MTGSDYCSVARVISVDAADNLTPATARQILAHNRSVRAVCGL